MGTWSVDGRGPAGRASDRHSFSPTGPLPEAWEIEELERIRAVHVAEERERLQIPIGDYRQVPGRVPSEWERMDGDTG